MVEGPDFLPAWPRAWLGWAFSHLGQFTEALEHAEAALLIAERTNHPHTVIEAHGALGGVSLEQGHLEAAQRLFERGVALLRARGVGDANLLSGLGYLYALSRRRCRCSKSRSGAKRRSARWGWVSPSA